MMKIAVCGASNKDTNTTKSDDEAILRKMEKTVFDDEIQVKSLPLQKININIK